jgi:hypothetical protein
LISKGIIIIAIVLMIFMVFRIFIYVVEGKVDDVIGGGVAGDPLPTTTITHCVVDP